MGIDRDRFAVNCSILFTELPLLERPAAAKRAGFSAVEFWWPFREPVAAEAEVDAFLEALRAAGTELTGLNFFAGDMPAGDRGVLSVPGRGAEFLANTEQVARIGAATGCRVFNALYGNRAEGADPEVQDDLALVNLQAAARAVEPIGGTVVLEPVSGVDAYPLRTAADAVAVLDRLAQAGIENARLLADLYHLAVNGDDVEQVIAEHSTRIGHVQLADAPGRHQPGTGELAIEKHLRLLGEAGYRGRIGLEYSPSGPSADSFGWLPEH
ncbi:hydroxypyruvate isomerase family protein [Sciscionella sediminilitoris]|uniref:hydroxypyruvate isomerase family protein n=1 Tax=Sciscionella sediminilitoris TaxID=1445613 RepID=UPI0004DEF49F|nr:TIM barrel protein [Sciscionella sp. SE31]